MKRENCFPSSGTHAVVIGGSLAGLMAARVLSDHFSRVTILERDAYLMPLSFARAYRKRAMCMCCYCAASAFLRASCRAFVTN